MYTERIDSATTASHRLAGPELQFAESVGLYFERNAGMPRMCGRVIGVLLICDPPEQSATDLGTALQASKGSISTATRTLIAARLIRRVAIEGTRRDYFRIDDEGWVDAVDGSLRSLASILDVLEHGRELLVGTGPKRRARIENVAGLYEWMRSELPPMLDRYRRERMHTTTERGDG